MPCDLMTECVATLCLLLQVQPYMPYEFTEEGMLQRVNTYISHQDFCTQLKSPWVPHESVQFILSRAGQSCKSACMQKGESNTQNYCHVLFPLTHMFTNNHM